MKKYYAGLMAGMLAAMLTAAPAMAADKEDYGDAVKDQSMILSELHLSNLSEVQMGKQAAQKASRPETKAFAQKIAADHGKNDKELKQLAAKLKIPLMLPSQDSKLESKQKDAQDMMEDVAKADHASYDKEFANMAVHMHQADVDEIESKAKDLSDGPVKDFLNRTLPVLKQHLAAAQQLDNTK